MSEFNGIPIMSLANEHIIGSNYEIPEIRNYQNADYQYEILCEYIKEFQDELDDNHEIGVQLASFG